MHDYCDICHREIEGSVCIKRDPRGPKFNLILDRACRCWFNRMMQLGKVVRVAKDWRN